ncbi:MAG: SH3 domain-containing protein [Haliscomenobacter sp.]|nr:SH3 domain-containing protein [Haliscomenobacter sp.]
MKNHLLLLSFVFWAGFSCRKQAPAPESPAELETVVDVFTVNVDGLQLRAAPGPEGKTIRGLQLGESLTDLGEVSDFTTAVQLRGIAFNEPWLKVKTEKGEEGWVYGGALSFSSGGKTASVLLEKRLQTFFGEPLARRIDAFRSDCETVSLSNALSACFLESVGLKDELNTKLESGIQIRESGELPDLFWLETAIPGYLPQLVAEGTVYTLFADYGAWRRKAEETEGKEDDAFFDLCIQFFPEDSIAYFFPAYFIQTWDYGGHSLLGRGIHRQLLSGLDRLFREKSPFIPEILRMKTDLVNDITAAEGTYWEKQEAIIQELKGILEAKYPILDKADLAALSTRLKQFGEPGKYGIVLNQQSGE